MIIHQNKQDKSGDNKIIQNSWKLQWEICWSLTIKNKFIYCEILASEASGEFFLMILVQTKWHFKWTRNCVYETLCPQQFARWCSSSYTTHHSESADQIWSFYL